MILNQQVNKNFSINFTKMHGLGNDFIIVKKQDITRFEISDLVIKMSKHHTGIGCDQFIVYDYSSNKPFITMEIYNQDGSPAKACGNASRCLTRMIFDQYGKREIILNVFDRNIHCTYIDGDSICVNMGVASFNESWMPNSKEIWSLAAIYNLDPKEIMCVDVGNPHLVIFSKLSKEDQAIIGELLQKPTLFPDGVNVNFASIEGDQIYLSLWERGAGMTLACGSGACATFAAADHLGFVRSQADVVFELGKLKMSNAKNHVQNQVSESGINMIGPASYVFHGEYYVT